MRIELFSDVICPWCYIGKRRLERALAERPLPGLVIDWRAFQLNPDMPADGMDRQAYLAAKFGPGRGAEIYENVRQVGEGEGIVFAFDRIRRTPNTVDAHRLVRWADDRGGADTMVETLFRGYFIEGADLTDRATLATLAGEAGQSAEDARDLLATPDLVDEIQTETRRAYAMGINGVPCFLVAGRYALSGAQPPEGLFPLFDLARQMASEAASAK